MLSSATRVDRGRFHGVYSVIFPIGVGERGEALEFNEL